ncbi:surfactin non-ribosomal peptide synthetase SrfAC [Scytonema sp. NUACC21]
MTLISGNKHNSAIKGKENLKDLYPLSPMQEGMLFHSLYDESAGTYLEQIFCSIIGNFNVNLFEKSWNELFKRHEILRTILIPQKAARPLQMVLKECEIDFYYQDIQHLSQQQQREFLENYQQQDLERGFNLDRDLLMRVTLFQSQPDRYEIIWTHHHILMDGWSCSLVLDELFEIYKALVDGRSINSYIAPPYSEFIQWLRQQNTEAARNYWQQYLQGYDYPIRIPRAQFPEKGYKTSEFIFELNEQITSQLEQLARNYQVTLSNLLQSIWAILLAKYNDVNDVVFGLTVSGRPPEIKDVEKMVGLFINTIPVRVRVNPELNFVQLIKLVQEDSIASKEYTYYSLADIQALSEHRSDSIDHVFVFQNYPQQEQVCEALEIDNYGFRFENVKVVEQSNYDFGIVVNLGEQLKFRFLYNEKAFSTAFLQRLQSHLYNIVLTILKTPDIAIGDIQIIGDRERQLLLSEFNDTDAVCNQEQTIIDLIETQTNLTPNATAVRFANKSLSYRELSAASDKIASYLCTEAQVNRGDAIGILQNPSENFLIAVLGVMKAGCGFLGLDPKAPIERNQAILKESGAKVVITDTTFSAELQNFPGSIFVMGNKHSVPIADPATAPTVHLPSPEDLAYVIFTSGSTGKPKGIAVNHRSLYQYISWCSKFYFRGRDLGNMPLFTSPAFDLTITSLFCPLIHGKTVVVLDREEIDDTLKQIFDLGDQIDIIKLTPSHISALKHLQIKQTAIGMAIVGGEGLQQEQVETLLALNPNIEIYNEYGPAEATVGCIVSQVREPEFITIGKPIDNTRIYILNKNLQLVPIGCVGEIYIAGSCLAEGYWKNPDLSASKFIDHPLEPKTKLYRSGDLGKWLENGEMICLGRKDDQVKIRGYRVELVEIETVLKQHPGVEDAVVLICETQEREQQLKAYLIPSDVQAQNQGVQLDNLVASIRSFASSQLPDYMIPNDLLFVDRFPLTYNGKLNKKALLEKTALIQRQNQVNDRPNNPTEIALAEIWQNLLGMPKVGVYDDFFTLGGHSLNALVMLSRIRKSLGVEIPLKSVFEFSTIRALSEYISSIGMYNDRHGKHQIALLNAESGRYVFALPTMFGYGIAFKGLAQYLKSYSVYGLDFIEDGDPIADYAQLLDFPPVESPYILLGYCVGGNLAFELAKELERRGRQVSDIIMLDSAPRTTTRSQSDAAIQKQVDAEIAYYSDYVKDDEDLSMLLRNPYFKAKLKAKTAAHIHYWNNRINDGQIRANIHLLRAAENHSVSEYVEQWANLTTGKVFTYNASGKHGDLLINEHLQYNALLIDGILEQIQQTSS